MLEKTEIIFDTIEEMIQEVSAYENKGVVKLASIVVFYNHIVPKIILKLKENGQPFTLDATTAESSQIIRNVSTGIDNLGIIIHSDELLNSDLEYVPLFSDRYLLYVGPSSPFWDAESITLEEVLQGALYCLSGRISEGPCSVDNCAGQTLYAQYHPAHRRFGAVEKMIAQDDYVAFFPEFMSQDDIYLQNGSIRAVPISDCKLEIEVGVYL